jgi:DNA repair protein RecN (Recombination protein N)
LAEAVSDKLQRLGFKQSQFDIAFQSCEAGGTGQDKVEFLFAPNPGETPQPLRKIASSGEIARVMLAIKTVLTAADEVPVLVFDEVDANVGGETARAVADEIISIARHHQVLSITHLPQIAATAQYHFKVSKEIVNDRTITSVDLLSHEERVDEIARMLGEPAGSSIGKQHATEMLERSELPKQPCTK